MVFVASVAGGCASSDKSYQVTFDQDVNLISETDGVKKIKSGETIELSDHPLTIAQEDHKTVVILPLPQKKGRVQIRLPKDAQKMNETAKAMPQSGSALSKEDQNKIAQNLVEIQQLMLEKRVDEALTKIQLVRSQFPDLSYLNFFEASCLAIKNEREKAIIMVEETLKDFPNDSVAKKFFSQLSENANNPKSNPNPSPSEQKRP